MRWGPGVIQFGISGDPKATAYWDQPIEGEPVKESNYAGVVAFAQKGENSRTTQLWVTLVANPYKDALGCSPVAEVESGWEVVKSINPEYGIRVNIERLKRERERVHF